MLKGFDGPTERKFLIAAICEKTGASERTVRDRIKAAVVSGLVIKHPGRPLKYSLSGPGTGNWQTGNLPTSEACQLEGSE